MMEGPGTFRPSRVLGLMLCGVVGLFVGFVVWQLMLPSDDKRLINKSDWIVLVSVLTAVIGWIVGAIVTLRNTVKQHTIDTLLQSRMSEMYMEKASAVKAGLTGAGGQVQRVTQAQLRAGMPGALLDNIVYFLNYFEFVAVAIRHGDLDEDLMRGSMRGMLCRFCEIAAEVITDQRAKAPRTYEHLLWLQRRWVDGSKAADGELGTLVAVYIAVTILSFLLAVVGLNAVTV